MDQLIPIINQIQDVFSVLGSDPIDLPSIAVVGTQSSGKSSVLENIVGRDFLPRGTGIVTRRPLILQLINRPDVVHEYGEFLHKPQEKLTDFNKIREEIIRETDKVTGSSKGISNKPINLKIYSPYVLNLTLIDLPGITRVAVGDQPKDIEIQILNMIKEYIERKNTIILAVSAANVDISTSDALKLAKEVDPQGLRTLGLLTKIDIVNRGENVLDILQNKVLPLKMGYIGVVNRNQEDINNKKNISEAQDNERHFFMNHPIYSAVAERAGTAYLSKQLNSILLNHIKTSIPELKVKIQKLLIDTRNEIKLFGDLNLLESNDAKGALILQIITQFVTEYKNVLNGNLNLKVTDLYGGAKVKKIFTTDFKDLIENKFSGLASSLIDAEIDIAIKNSSGLSGGLFIKDEAFTTLVQQQIMKFEQPALACVDQIYKELCLIVSRLEVRELERFVNLKNHILNLTNRLLLERSDLTKKIITDLVKVELSYINTSHPDFIGIEQAHMDVIVKLDPGLSQVSGQGQVSSQQVKPRNPSDQIFRNEPVRRMEPDVKHVSVKVENDRHKFEIELIKTLILSYLEIIKKNVLDLIPKHIMYFLIKNSKEALQQELVSGLYRYDLFEELLTESDGIREKQIQLKKLVQNLEMADKILDGVNSGSL